MQYIKQETRANAATTAILEGLEDWIEIRQITAHRRIEREAKQAEEYESVPWLSKEEISKFQASSDWRRNNLASAAQRRIYASRARRRAKKEGVHFWPALVDLSVDIEAVYVAQTVLAKKYGARGWKVTGEFNHGGWDSEGDKGISRKKLEYSWLAAGCKNTRKYRAQIAADVIAQKGETFPEFCNFLRGYHWAKKNARHLLLHRKAITVLGRLSAKLRWAAIADLPRDSRIRVRDLNWGAVKEMQEALRVGNRKLVATYLGSIGALLEMGVENMHELRAKLCPAFPTVPFNIAMKVARGWSPVRIADGRLTSKEAHRWLLAGAPEMASWLSEELDVPEHRDVPVVRWMRALKDGKRWGTMTKTRTVMHGGERVEFSALQILDEIMEEDIVTGKDAVDDVLARASERRSKDFTEAYRGDHSVLAPKPVWARELPGFARVLRTPAALIHRGEKENHCVGTYVEAVRNQSCVIVAISTRHGESTAELSYDGTACRQLYAAKNTTPPRRHEQWMRAFVARLKRKSRTTIVGSWAA